MEQGRRTDARQDNSPYEVIYDSQRKDAEPNNYNKWREYESALEGAPILTDVKPIPAQRVSVESTIAIKKNAR